MAKKKISDKEKIKELRLEVSTLKRQIEKQEANISFTVKNSKPGVEIFVPMEAINQDMSLITNSYNNTTVSKIETSSILEGDTFDTVPIENEETIEEEPLKKPKKEPKYKKVVVTGGVSWGKVGFVILVLVIIAIIALVKLS